MVQQTTKAFIKLGLESRHSVGILAFNCPEWFYSALGAVFAGGLAAGIYTTNSADAIRHILDKSLSNIVVVEDARQLNKIVAIRDQLPLLKSVILLNGDLCPSLSSADGYFTWNEVQMMDLSDVDSEYAVRMAEITPNQSATLIFTVSREIHSFLILPLINLYFFPPSPEPLECRKESYLATTR